MAKKLQVIIDGKQFVSKATKEASDAISDMAKTTDVKSKAMTAAATSVKIAFAGIAVAIGSVAVIAGKALKEAADMETVSTSFEVLIGDAKRAKAVLMDLRKFAAQTPLQFEDITKGAQTLMAFGSAAEDVRDQMQMLGDISMGQADKLESIVRAFGKIQAKGKASMEELNMVTEAGVPILGELASMYGKTTDEVLKMVSAGTVGFDDINQAFINMTSSGGKFYGMLDRQSQTFNGLVSTLKDNLSLLLTRLGETILPTATKILGDALDNLNAFMESDAFDAFALRLTIFATQTYEVFKNVGLLVSALYADIKNYITTLFSPDVGSIAVKYAESLMNNLINYWNMPLKLSDYLWEALGLPKTAKIPNVDITPETERGKFVSALDGVVVDLAKIASDITATWMQAKTEAAKQEPIPVIIEPAKETPPLVARPTLPGSLSVSGNFYDDMNARARAMYGGTNVPTWHPVEIGLAEKAFEPSIFEKIGTIFGDMVDRALPLITSLVSIQSLLDPIGTILGAAMEVLGSVIDTVLAPLVGILKVVGTLLGSVLAPVVQLLTPAIELVGEVFIWLYNKILLPIGNGLIFLFNLVYNGIAGVVNGLIAAINFLFGWIGVNMQQIAYKPLTSGFMSEIDRATLYSSGGASGSTYTGGGTGSSTSVQSVNINIYQNFNGNVIGDGGLEQVGGYMIEAIRAYAGVGGNVQVLTA